MKSRIKQKEKHIIRKEIYGREIKRGKKAIVGSLIETYEIKTAKDIQNALKDLLGGTLQEMLESELDEQLGYENCKFCTATAQSSACICVIHICGGD